MQSTALTLLSPASQPAQTRDGLESLANPLETAVSADNTSVEPIGLFSALLGQLAPEQPIVTPAPAQSPVILPAGTPVIAAEVLPPAGNELPLLTVPVTIDAELLPPATPLDQAELLLLTDVLRQTGPALAAATETDAPVTVVAPVIATVVRPPEPGKAATAQRPVVDVTGLVEQKAVKDSAPAPVLAKNHDFSVERPVIVPVQQPGIQQAPLSTSTDTPAALLAASPTPATPATPSQPTPSLTLHHPISDARWGDSLSQRVIWMTENGMGRAEIRLNPPELGPLNVRVTVANDEARVAFSVQHGATKDLVEAALPRLREMFADQGIDLTDASVSQHSSGNGHQAGDPGDSSQNSGYGKAPIDAGFDEAEQLPARTIAHEGFIDTYV